MTRRHLRLAVMLVFAGLFFALVVMQKSQTARILIIHSNDPAYPWVASVNEGLKRGFEGRRNVLFRYHYMDLKNHTDAAFKERAATLALNAVDSWAPDVLVLVDDEAQALVGKAVVAPGPGAPGVRVVFSGVNGEPADYYPPGAEVTGILERKPLPAIRDAALSIALESATRPPRARPRVQFIGDHSSSITAEIPTYEGFDWSPAEFLPPVQVDTFADWQAAVERAEREADVILVTNYRNIRDGVDGPFLRPAAQVMQWTAEHATVPVIGMGATNSEDGAMLTVSVSPFEQGEVAAALALQVLDGTPPASLPVVASKQFIVQVCTPSLARWGLTLPPLYEAFARATDHYYEEGC